MLFWFVYVKDNERESLGPLDLRSELHWMSYMLNIKNYDTKFFWKYLKDYNLRSINILDTEESEYISNILSSTKDIKMTIVKSFLTYIFEDALVSRFFQFF